jgi:hypothetical protein
MVLPTRLTTTRYVRELANNLNTDFEIEVGCRHDLTITMDLALLGFIQDHDTSPPSNTCSEPWPNIRVPYALHWARAAKDDTEPPDPCLTPPACNASWLKGAR